MKKDYWTVRPKDSISVKKLQEYVEEFFFFKHFIERAVMDHNKDKYNHKLAVLKSSMNIFNVTILEYNKFDIFLLDTFYDLEKAADPKKFKRLGREEVSTDNALIFHRNCFIRVIAVFIPDENNKISAKTLHRVTLMNNHELSETNIGRVNLEELLNKHYFHEYSELKKDSKK